jgi:hypothetical protein
MIDVWTVFTNLVWISGLALALAAFSYADWRVSLGATSIRHSMRNTAQNPAFISGIALTCLGAGLSVWPVWQRVVWFVLAACLAIAAAWLHIQHKSSG